MTEQNQQQNFYPLTEEEFAAMIPLQPAERDLLLWIKAETASGSEYETTVAALANRLGRSRNVITRALNALVQQDWISIRSCRATKFITAHPFKSQTEQAEEEV